MTLGKANFILKRWRDNVGMGQFLLTSYIAIMIGKFPLWLFILFVIVSAIYTIWYDLKYIYPKENLSSSELNPAWTMQMDLLKEIRDKVSEKEIEMKK